jgi:hypothetical protein
MKIGTKEPVRIVTDNTDAIKVYQGADLVWTAREGKIYYVAANGSDSNSGLRREEPWQTLNKVNSFTFDPGDSILFKRGDSWIGQLKPQGGGTASNPILLSAYSDGAHPYINGNGAEFFTAETAEGVIHLVNQSYWIIDGFEVTSWSNIESYRYGILVKSTNASTTGVTIRNNFVHDVMGGRVATNAFINDITVEGRNTGGIVVSAPQGGFNDICIENNTLERIVGVGIYVYGPKEYIEDSSSSESFSFESSSESM